MEDGALGLRGDTAVKPVEMELERGHELADAHQRKELAQHASAQLFKILIVWKAFVRL